MRAPVHALGRAAARVPARHAAVPRRHARRPVRGDPRRLRSAGAAAPRAPVARCVGGADDGARARGPTAVTPAPRRSPTTSPRCSKAVRCRLARRAACACCAPPRAAIRCWQPRRRRWCCCSAPSRWSCVSASNRQLRVALGEARWLADARLVRSLAEGMLHVPAHRPEGAPAALRAWLARAGRLAARLPSTARTSPNCAGWRCHTATPSAPRMRRAAPQQLGLETMTKRLAGVDQRIANDQAEAAERADRAALAAAVARACANAPPHAARGGSRIRTSRGDAKRSPRWSRSSPRSPPGRPRRPRPHAHRRSRPAARDRRRRVARGAATLARGRGEVADPVRSPRPRGLVLPPQFGLLPLGRDPHSGLQEFARLRSGAPARRAANGALELAADTGVVLVLLPAPHSSRATPSRRRIGTILSPGTSGHRRGARTLPRRQHGRLRDAHARRPAVAATAPSDGERVVAGRRPDDGGDGPVPADGSAMGASRARRHDAHLVVRRRGRRPGGGGQPVRRDVPARRAGGRRTMPAPPVRRRLGGAHDGRGTAESVRHRRHDRQRRRMVRRRVAGPGARCHCATATASPACRRPTNTRLSRRLDSARRCRSPSPVRARPRGSWTTRTRSASAPPAASSGSRPAAAANVAAAPPRPAPAATPPAHLGHRHGAGEQPICAG